ncbi:MAG: aminotransferase class I/II-fold pyridoxal phosphate-dependent enzyme [Ruminococcus sp.]|nr:aminotransferase class I/II-fold pyridoxal phosphate-dependent enzyme [Ruminococcus sp.]
MNVSDIKYNEIRCDFSSSLNPFGMPSAVKKAALEAAEDCTKAVDSEYEDLRRLISYYEEFPEANIAIGCGGDDMIYRICAATRPKKALIFSPCSPEYCRALEQNGCSVTDLRLSKRNNYKLTADVAQFIEYDTDLIILNNPCDPTGEVISPYTLSVIAEKCRRTNTIIVCDERYMDFVNGIVRYSVSRFKGIRFILVKSFTRMFAMAGIPVGYALCSHRTMSDVLRNTGAPHSVSVSALAAAETAVGMRKYMRLTQKYIEIERNRLAVSLTNLGIRVYPSKSSVFMIKSDLPLDMLLRRRGILIKNCAEAYDLDEGYFRIAVGLKENNDILLDTLGKIIQMF